MSLWAALLERLGIGAPDGYVQVQGEFVNIRRARAKVVLSFPSGCANLQEWTYLLRFPNGAWARFIKQECRSTWGHEITPQEAADMIAQRTAGRECDWLHSKYFPGAASLRKEKR